MDYLNSILNSQNQVQSVEEAIPTLCNRLQHANLSSDRRSAILGLKSFSRQYRENVVEYGLRPLILTLKRDLENPSIIKAILETFLILFIRGETDEDLTRGGWISQQSRLQNGKYPSPLLMEDVSLDQFSLWIADELTQDREIIETLIEILSNNHDFHIRLYSLQLLEALVSSRTIRTKDWILSIPTSISVIVSLLSDINEPVRNEAILLLMAVVNNNFNIQKLVAFENTFDKLFDIIDEEGGIRGSILVQDCLTLITNLLQYNASNQKFFLETQCIPRLAKLLDEPMEESFEDTNLSEGENGFPQPLPPMVWTEQRLANMIIALEICRIFVYDNEFVKSNQDKLFSAGVHFIVLKLVFSPYTQNSVRSIALLTAGDFIAGNSDIQYEFSQIDVPYIDPSMPSQIQTYDKPIPVPMVLLNWTLYINSVHCFDIRTNSAYCLHSYFKDNKDSKAAFLSDQIKAYTIPGYYESHQQEENEDGKRSNGSDENGSSISNGHAISPPYGNIFSTLMDYNSEIKINPYRIWFASLILIYLFEDSNENKDIARSVKTGDENAGEEVMSSIQAISGLLLTTLEGVDQRVAIGYLMLLSVWLYEDLAAVNDFLSDATISKSILAFLTNNSSESAVLIHGMATILLGIAYEFSSKDSPITRSDLSSLLVKSLGRDNYALKVKQFKDREIFKNFDEESNYLHNRKDETGLPDVFFDSSYVNLIKQNFGRIKKALFHDPNSEPHGRISYELFEELDNQVGELKKDLDQERESSSSKESKLNQEIAILNANYVDLENKLQATESELQKLKTDHLNVREKFSLTSKSLESLEKEKKDLHSSSTKYHSELQESLRKASTSGELVKSLTSKLENTELAKKKLEDGINNMTKDLFHLKRQKNESETAIKKLEKDVSLAKDEITHSKKAYDGQIEKLNKANEVLKGTIDELHKKISAIGSDNETKFRALSEKLEETEESNEHLMDKLRSAAAAFQEMKQEKSNADDKVKEQSEKHAKVVAELGTLKEQLEEKEKSIVELGELRGQLSKLKNSNLEIDEKFSEFKQKYTTEVESLNKQISVLEISNDELSTKNKDLQDEINSLREDLDVNVKKHELSKLERDTQLEEMQTSHEKLELEIAETKKSRDAIQYEHKDLLEQFENSKSAHADTKQELEQRLAALVQQSDSNQREFSTKEASQKSEFEKRISTLNSKKLESENEIIELNTRLAGTRNDLDKSNKKLAQAEKELSTSQTRTEQIEKELTEAEKVSEGLQGEVTELTMLKSNLESNLKTKEESVNTIVSELDRTKADLVKLQEDHKNAIVKLEALHGEEITVLRGDLEKSKSNSEVSHRKELDKVTNELDKVTNEIIELEGKFSKFRNESETAEATSVSKIVDFKRQNESLSKEIMSLKLKLEEAESELLAKTTKHDEIVSVVVSLRSSLEEEQSKFLSLNDEKTELEGNFQTIKNDFDTQAKELIESTKKNDILKDLQRKSESEMKDIQKKSARELEELQRNSEKELQSLKEKLDAETTKLQSKYSKEQADLQSKLSDKDLKIVSLEKELNEKIVELEKEREMLSQNSETVIKEYGDKIKLLEARLASEAQEYTKRIDDLKQDKLRANESLESIKSELDVSTKKVGEHQAQYEEATKEFEKLKNELVTENDAKLRERESRLKNFESRVEQGNSKVKDLTSKLLESSTEITSHIAKISNLEAKLSSLEGTKAEANALQTKFEATNKSLEKVEADLVSKNKQEETLKGEISEFRALITTLETSNKDYTGKLEELKEQSKTDQSSIKELKESSKLDKESIQKLTDELKGSKGSSSKALENLNKLAGKLELKEKELIAFEAKHLELKEVLAKNMSDAEKSKHELESRLKSSQELEAQLKALREETTSKDKQLKALETSKNESKESLKAVTNLQTEVSDLKAKLEEQKEESKRFEIVGVKLNKAELELKDSKASNEKLIEDKAIFEAKVKSLETSSTKLDEIAKNLVDETKLKETALAKVKELESDNKQLLEDKSSLKEKGDEVTKLKSLIEEQQQKTEGLQKLNENEKLRTSELTKVLEERNSKIEKFQSEQNDAAKMEAKLKAEIESLSGKLKEKSTDLVPKSDLDDLMLLMTEMDETAKKYKKQLKALGQEVSSDEESDDEEDDEDEDEDDE